MTSTITEMMKTYPAEINADREVGPVRRSLRGVRAGLYRLRRRVPEQGDGRRAREVHPHRRGLRRHLRDHGSRAVATHRLRREHHPRGAAGLRSGVQLVRRGVRKARRDARALPHLRRGVPPLRGRVQPRPNRHRLTRRAGHWFGCGGGAGRPGLDDRRRIGAPDLITAQLGRSSR